MSDEPRAGLEKPLLEARQGPALDGSASDGDPRQRGTLIAFGIGARDAKILADEFFPEFSIEDLVGLPKYHVYLRLMIDGVVSRGFSAVTVGPPILRRQRPDELR